jgi:hypothetical protein
MPELDQFSDAVDNLLAPLISQAHSSGRSVLYAAVFPAIHGPARDHCV